MKNIGRTTLLFGCILTLTISSAIAQIGELKEEKQKAEELKLQQEVLRYKELETKLLEQAFEKPIDPDTYIVGPGDYFALTIWGDIQKVIQVVVSPEGLLSLPTIGVLKVADLTLRQAQSVVEEAALNRYRDLPVTLQLLMMRKIRVHVTGQVLNPGTFVATPVDRLSDLIFRAGNLKNFADARNVVIYHDDGSIDSVNFVHFLAFGDVNQNPFVRGGDVILVPSMDLATPHVRVTGMVPRQGFFPLESNETVEQFIRRNGLLVAQQELRSVELIRMGKTVAVLDLTRQSDLQTKLEQGDVLHFPIDTPKIYVIGAVQKPGPYDYYRNYSVADYVGLAGATENGTGLSGARVRRAKTGKIESADDILLQPGDIIEIPLRRSRRWSEYLQIASQLATIVIAYFAIRR